MSLFRILSIDGGGIRGIIPATLLTYLESCLQKNSGNKNARLADYFDLIAGTSTGGILAALYLTPDETHQPRYSAAEALNFYKENGSLIFHKSLWHVIKSLNGFLGARYPATTLDELLQKFFGSLRLSELLKPCLIPSFDIKNNKAIFFNQTDPTQQHKEDFFVRHIVRATTAAPSYFPVAEITSCENTPFTLVDGGVFANNPTLCAYIEAHKVNNSAISPQETLILSLGTGSPLKTFNTRTLRYGGVSQWAFPLLDILLSSNAEIVHHKMKVLFDERAASENYLRIQTNFTNLGYPDLPLDAAKPNDINLLCALSDQLTNDYKEDLDEFSKKLIANS
nr:patatin-like phospholipase family protein [uncultured Cellulosilyticum sp.]